MYDYTLKVENLCEYETHYVVHRDSHDALKPLYSSTEFGKRRFLLHRKKQKFDATFINSTVQKFIEGTRSDRFIVAYGNGNFSLSMKGMDGGGSAHQ